MDRRKLNKNRKLVKVILSAAAYAAACMTVLFVSSMVLNKKRKRITYGPMEERDKTRIDYLNSKIYKDDITSQKCYGSREYLSFDCVKCYVNAHCFVTPYMYVSRNKLQCF
jgi:hypothetical protein